MSRRKHNKRYSKDFYQGRRTYIWLARTDSGRHSQVRVTTWGRPGYGQTRVA